MGGLLICMLIGMVTTGLGLMCMQCSNNLNTRCTGELKNCSQDQVCVSTLMQTIYIGSQTTHTFERDCGAESQCNASSSISSLISISSRSGCCRTDNCTVDIPSFSNVTKPVNSVQCPVCLTHDRSCFTSKLTNCTGDEKYCASFEMYTGNSGGKVKPEKNDTELTAPPAG
ncbi:uncharacterized protein ACMZJ9_019421 [Mantella aurantiaca]